MSVETVRLVLVDRDDLTGLTTWAECILCGCSEMHAITDTSERVWDGDPAACAGCGAIDTWNCDVEDGAHLMGRPDEGGEVEVLRSVWLDGGRAEWEERARGVDAGQICYVVVDGDSVMPLLQAVHHLPHGLDGSAAPCGWREDGDQDLDDRWTDDAAGVTCRLCRLADPASHARPPLAGRSVYHAQAPEPWPAGLPRCNHWHAMQGRVALVEAPAHLITCRQCLRALAALEATS